eukprot:30918-Pelagococcus_subviridis.AAC.32
MHPSVTLSDAAVSASHHVHLSVHVVPPAAAASIRVDVRRRVVGRAPAALTVVREKIHPGHVPAVADAVPTRARLSARAAHVVRTIVRRRPALQQRVHAPRERAPESFGQLVLAAKVAVIHR